MNPREVEESIRRIESDMYYDSEGILVRLARIEVKLENVATKKDLDMKTTGLKAELINHANSTFRWTMGIFILGTGVLLSVLKLT